MKASRISSWAFESIAAVLALYSLCILGWLLRQTVRDLTGPTLHAGPGGMPGNGAAGVGIAMWIGTGLVAALLGYTVALAALPEDKASRAWRFGRIVQRASIIGFITPIVLFATALVLD